MAKAPRVEAFFAYARERHAIHLRRAAGLPREQWTDDPIFMQFRFTNVFRELDKTTQWFRQHVRDPMRNKPEVLLATVLFRMLNRIAVGEAMFCQQYLLSATKKKVRGTKLVMSTGRTAFEEFLETGDTRSLKHAIHTYVGKRGPFATGAYIITSPTGYSKLDGILKIVGDFYKSKGHVIPGSGLTTLVDWRGMAKILGTNASWSTVDSKAVVGLRDTWAWLGQFPFFGTFHSYEIVTDLRHTALLDKAPDIMTWANIGPGCRRGLNRIHGRSMQGRKKPVVWSNPLSDEQALNEMTALLACSRDEKFWPQGKPTRKVYLIHGVGVREQWPAWEMRDVEHTLCEFDKYERVRTGEGRPRGVYR